MITVFCAAAVVMALDGEKTGAWLFLAGATIAWVIQVSLVTIGKMAEKRR